MEDGGPPSLLQAGVLTQHSKKTPIPRPTAFAKGRLIYNQTGNLRARSAQGVFGFVDQFLVSAPIQLVTGKRDRQNWVGRVGLLPRE